MLGHLRVARDDAERPQGATVRILRSRVFAPRAIEIHEIAEPARILVPRMLDDRRVYRRPAVADIVGEILDLRHMDQRARIVVAEIAMAAIENGNAPCRERVCPYV